MRSEGERRRGSGRGIREAALALALALAPGLPAADSTSLGTFKQWTALSFPDGKGTSCMMWSQPEQAQGAMAGRGEAFMFVTHSTSPRAYDAVSLENGYAFAEGTPARVRIGSEEFVLETDGGSAWTRDAGDDARLVQAMRAGYTMSVQGVSAGGNRTSDVYSLLGFTAAHEAINEACGRG